MSSHERHITIVDNAAEYDDLEVEGGLRILVPRGVYHPHELSSTRLLLGALPEVVGLDVLEIGGGSGALALAIKRRGAARVVVTDISERACAAMECNALLNHVDINPITGLDVRQGDMFDPLTKGERFDLVVFNLPLMDKRVENLAEVALCDPDGELLTKFLRWLPEVTKPKGMALFTHATISAPLPLNVPGRIQTVAQVQRENGEIFRVLQWRP
jgi:methylase of polypeptide subunit release factors